MKHLSGIGIELCFEHHPREKWDWYADQAKALGVSFIRQGEFIWDLLEIEEGVFNFEELDTFISILDERGIKTWLATPTAAPPDWICHDTPEVLPISIDGVRMSPDTRRHTCPTSPAYRRHAQRIVTALGQRYGKHPGVIAWQIDNEIGHPFCYCSLCHQAFQHWLECEFEGDIQAFNQATGQFFWARTSRRFNEVPLPCPSSNPCLKQIYHRFMDHQIRECWGLQRQWLRDAGVTGQITTNAMLTWHGYNHEKFFADLDIVTGDTYPTTHSSLYKQGRFPGLSFLAGFMRGMKHGKNFGLAEMRCGPAEELVQYPMPGEIRYWSHAFFGTGADFVSFFRLDTCPSGFERNACGMLPVSRAIPRVFSEMQQLCREAHTLEPLLKESRVERASVGLLYTFPSHVAAAIRPEYVEFEGPFGNGYTMHLAKHFRAISNQGFAADVVFPGDDLSMYPVLILSGMAVIDPVLGSRLEQYVQQGGCLILWPWCGVMDENGKMYEEIQPVFLGDVSGARVIVTEEFSTAHFSIGINDNHGRRYRSSGIVQTLEAVSEGVVLARIEGCPALDGLPGIIERRKNAGICYTIAAQMEETSLGSFYQWLLTRQDIHPDYVLPENIHQAKRKGRGFELLFIFNSGNQPQHLRASQTLEEVLQGRRCERFTLQPLGVCVFKLPLSADANLTFSNETMD